MTRKTKIDGPVLPDPPGAGPLISSYQFDLPSRLIAQEPAHQRSASRCLFCSRNSDGATEAPFHTLADRLVGDEILVVNDTRVLPARIRCHRQSGGAIEAFLLRPLGQGRWQSWLSPSRRIQAGEILETSGPPLRVIERRGSGWIVELGSEEVLEQIGEIPLPPYIERKKEDPRLQDLDPQRYQTIFARQPGAVAAPTAGLHFDDPLLSRLKKKGVQIVPVTLHVGPGTFKPIEVDRISQHRVDPEWYFVSEESRTMLAKARADGRKIIAVGTTSLRVLESVGRIEEGPDLEAETDLTILPGHPFEHVDGLITNFHLPRSSLLVLVCSFLGRRRTLSIYQQAIDLGLRFYSYGDCMAILPEELDR
ncbi:MAG: tRNA preQ1(34) S-adenosylmethionine ribosyltransferase-isomerase QueA [Planctomycetota bacterium]|nr:tRNA preQ1(34) S-adenosylmethionine ribosyltransferase-isomerase QueA [Planctomycetota bacterium]